MGRILMFMWVESISLNETVGFESINEEPHIETRVQLYLSCKG